MIDFVDNSDVAVNGTTKNSFFRTAPNRMRDKIVS
jgi:hypothetical protein